MDAALKETIADYILPESLLNVNVGQSIIAENLSVAKNMSQRQNAMCHSEMKIMFGCFV